MSESQNSKLIESLVKAKAEVKVAEMDSVNPHFKSRYASLNAVETAYKEAFTKYGLAIVHSFEKDESGLSMKTVLCHADGGVVSCGSIPLLTGKGDATMQHLGSAITYARRYSIAMIAGVVAEEDEDGAFASGNGKPSQKAQPNSWLKKDKDDLQAYAQKLGMSNDDVVSHAQKKFGKDWSKLTPDEKHKVLDALKTEAEKIGQNNEASG